MKTLVEKYKGFNIYFESLPEETAISELLPDDTEEQRQEVIRNNEIFVAKVTAEFNGFELASDYLGGCIYESEEELQQICEAFNIGNLRSWRQSKEQPFEGYLLTEFNTTIGETYKHWFKL